MRLVACLIIWELYPPQRPRSPVTTTRETFFTSRTSRMGSSTSSDLQASNTVLKTYVFKWWRVWLGMDDAADVCWLRITCYYHLKLTDQWASFEDGLLSSSNTGRGNKSHCLSDSAGIFDTLNAISKITSLAVHHNCWSSNRRSRHNICWGECLDAREEQHAADSSDRKNSRHLSKNSQSNSIEVSKWVAIEYCIQYRYPIRLLLPWIDLKSEWILLLLLHCLLLCAVCCSVLPSHVLPG